MVRVTPNVSREESPRHLPGPELVLLNSPWEAAFGLGVAVCHQQGSVWPRLQWTGLPKATGKAGPMWLVSLPYHTLRPCTRTQDLPPPSG